MNRAITQPGQAMRRRLNTGTVCGQRSMTSARVIESRSSGFIVALAGEGSGHPHATARRAIQLALAQARRSWWVGRRSRLLGDLHQPMRLRDDEQRSEEHTSELQSLMR